MTLLFWMLACTSGSSDSGLDPDTYDGPVDLPVLEIFSPDRALFTGEGAVSLTGKATKGTWDLVRLEVNGQSLELSSNGGFSEDLILEPGLQIFGVRLEDVGGERAVDGRAIYHGPVRASGDWVEDGIRLQIGPELLDDNDSDLDDIAAIGELVLSDPSLLEGILGTPIVTDDVTITPTYFYFSSTAIDLEPRSGVLWSEITVYNPFMEFDLNDIAGFSWLSTEGYTWMDSVTVEIGLSPRNSGGEIRVDVTEVSSSQSGFGLELEWVPEFVEDYLVTRLEEELQTQIRALVEDNLPSLIEGLLNSLMIEQEVGDDLILEVALSDIDVEPDGVRVTGDGRVYLEGVDLSGLPAGAGSLHTDASAPAWPLSDLPFSAAMDDDIVNQILFGLWAQGELGGFSFSGLKIGALSGAPLPAPLGPAESVSFDILLPPVLSAPEDEGHTADISIGEFQIVFYREDGEVLDFSVNIRTGTELVLDENQDLSVSMDNRPAYMTIEVGTRQWPDDVDPGDLAALIRLVMPALLGNVGNFLPDISLPTVPIGDLVPLDEFEDLEMVMTDFEIETRSSHWVVLSSGLQAE